MRKPSTSRMTTGVALCFLTLLVLALIFVPRRDGYLASALLSVLFAILAVRIFKRRTQPSVQSRQVLFILVLAGVLYVMLFLLSGIPFGFYLSSTPFSLENLLRYVLPITAAIIATECVRSVFLAQRGILSAVYGYLICLLSEVLLHATLRDVTSFTRFMDLVGMALLPAIAGGLLYQYLSSRHGMAPALVYRLILALFPYFVPITSGIPDSLVSFAGLVIPLLLYVFVKKLYERKSVKAIKRLGKWFIGGVASTVLVMLSFVMLISCQFRFGLLVIATESMTGEYNKGDGIFYESFEGQPIAEDDVLVFEKDGLTIVHRVVEIECINGENRYITKGDANDDVDVGYITDRDVVGIGKAKIPYFGYVTLWMRDLFVRK